MARPNFHDIRSSESRPRRQECRRHRARIPGSEADGTIAEMETPRGTRWTRLEMGVLLLAVALFSTVSWAIAQIRLLWYDEIYTRQVALLGSWNRIVTALHHGMDLQPPLFYFLTAWTRNIGDKEVGLRLPAMLGFTFAGFSLYGIARRWCSPG
jgi:Na+-transporting NADH:ubiquinone oxidoreductase subunit NqrB